MKKKKATYKQLIAYMDQIDLRIKNNQQAVYDIAQLLSDYIEMSGDESKLQHHMNIKYDLGSDAGIPTRWSVFFNSIKTRYLKLKKRLAWYL